MNDNESLNDLSTAPEIESIEIIEVLGKGGMSLVYKARQMQLDRIVAVKVLSKMAIPGNDGIKRFQREAKLTSTLEHPNIVETISFGVSKDGQPYLIMEYLEGVSLADDLKQNGRLKLQKFKDVFLPALSALGQAHQAGMIHRDIKPGNIMICRNETGGETVKLVDFGIAKVFGEAETETQNLTKSGALLGSPAYMSPEQCQGKSLDGRSDLYSMACVMYESLSGEPPFSGDSLLEVMQKHTVQPPPTVSDLSRKIDICKELAKVTLWGLAKDPNERPQTASEFARKLDEVLERITLDKVPRLKKPAAAVSSRILTPQSLTIALTIGAVMLGVILLVARSKTDQRLVDPMSTPSFGHTTLMVIREAQHQKDPRKVEERYLTAARLARERHERQYQMVATAALVIFYSNNVTSYNNEFWCFDAKTGREDVEAMRRCLLEAKQLLVADPELNQQDGLPHTIGLAKAIAICAENSHQADDKEFFWEHAYNVLVNDKRNKRRHEFQKHVVGIGSAYVECLRRKGKFKMAAELEMAVQKQRLLTSNEFDGSNMDQQPGTVLFLQRALRMHQTDALKVEGDLLTACRLAEEREEPGYRMEAIGALVALYGNHAWWLDVPVEKKAEALHWQLAEAKRLLTESPNLRQKYNRYDTLALVEYIAICAHNSAKASNDQEFFLEHAYRTAIGDKRNERCPRFKSVFFNIGAEYAQILRRNGKTKTAVDVEAVVKRYRAQQKG